MEQMERDALGAGGGEKLDWDHGQAERDVEVLQGREALRGMVSLATRRRVAVLAIIAARAIIGADDAALSTC
jgi:hypothetical protein